MFSYDSLFPSTEQDSLSSLRRLQAFDRQATYATFAALESDETPPTRYLHPTLDPFSNLFRKTGSVRSFPLHHFPLKIFSLSSALRITDSDFLYQYTSNLWPDTDQGYLAGTNKHGQRD